MPTVKTKPGRSSWAILNVAIKPGRSPWVILALWIEQGRSSWACPSFQIMPGMSPRFSQDFQEEPGRRPWLMSDVQVVPGMLSWAGSVIYIMPVLWEGLMARSLVVESSVGRLYLVSSDWKLCREYGDLFFLPLDFLKTHQGCRLRIDWEALFVEYRHRS